MRFESECFENVSGAEGRENRKAQTLDYDRMLKDQVSEQRAVKAR